MIWTRDSQVCPFFLWKWLRYRKNLDESWGSSSLAPHSCWRVSLLPLIVVAGLIWSSSTSFISEVGKRKIWKLKMIIFPPISRVRNLGVAAVHSFSSGSQRMQKCSRKAESLEASFKQRKSYNTFKVSLADCTTSGTNGNLIGDYLPHISISRMIMIKQ